MLGTKVVQLKVLKMDVADEEHILSAIKVIHKQQQKEDKSSISSFLDLKHGLSISAVMQTMDCMLDSAAIYCNPLDVKSDSEERN